MNPYPAGFHGWSIDEKNIWWTAESARMAAEHKTNGGQTQTTQIHFVVPEPLPLFPARQPAAPYPVEALGSLAPAVRAIANKVQVPECVAAQSVLAVAALAAQSHADVQLPFGQTRPLSEFFVTVAGSGDRKSSADSEAALPVVRREQTLRDEYTAAIEEWRISHAVWDGERRKIEGNKKVDRLGRHALLADLGPEPARPLSPFLVTSDLTLDGLIKNWAHSHASLAVFTSEGATFTSGHGMSPENRLRTAASLSELWDGHPIKRIRAQDGVSILAGRRLSFHVMLQPDASAGFLNDRMLADQGLLSRVLVAAPESIAGERLFRQPNPEELREIDHYAERILRLLATPAPMVSGTRNELSPRILSMSDSATELWRQFHDHVEGQCGAGGHLALMRDFASKAAEHAARIAGVLTIVEDNTSEQVGFPAMNSAVNLMNWYIGEAERVRSAARTSLRLQRASALLDWMKAQGGECQFRSILQFGPHALRTKQAAEDAVAILLDHGRIVQAAERPRTFRLILEASL